MELHDRIHMARRHAGLTQQQCADTVGVALSTWKNWESGKVSPRVDALTAFAHAAGVHLHDLIEPENSR